MKVLLFEPIIKQRKKVQSV